MKNTLAALAAAICLLLATQQQASAWSKFNFGVGLNLGYEGGGNSVLWGALKGGPSPGQSDGYFPSGPGFEAAPVLPNEAPKPMPAPEKLVPPVPVKPAAYYSAPYQPVGYYSLPYQDMGYYPYYYYPTYYSR